MQLSITVFIDLDVKEKLTFTLDTILIKDITKNCIENFLFYFYKILKKKKFYYCNDIYYICNERDTREIWNWREGGPARENVNGGKSDRAVLFRWFRWRCRRVMHRITFVSRARIIERPFTCHTGRKSKRAVVKSFVEEDTLIFMIEIVRACRSYVHDYFLPRSNEFRF